MNQAFIYLIMDPLTNDIVYVGQTKWYPQHRFANHRVGTKETKIGRFILSLKEQGLKPVFEVIEICHKDIADFWELHYMFLYQSWGFQLMNTRWPKAKRKNDNKNISKLFKQKGLTIKYVCETLKISKSCMIGYLYQNTISPEKRIIVQNFINTLK